ncbi:hypothetical protein [Variovorax boronicumulans]|uniref:hypothetical protein n=1 Tax=Variovorax boronicumulans TaxID=436515 RepID=UPI001330F2C6|nr:hypothetical protein [Variovorax boronicumulans]
MKQLILSDPHAAFETAEAPKSMDYDVAVLADATMASGRVAVGRLRNPARFGDKPIAQVAGSHEYYEAVRGREDVEMRRQYHQATLLRRHSLAFLPGARRQWKSSTSSLIHACCAGRLFRRSESSGARSSIGTQDVAPTPRGSSQAATARAQQLKNFCRAAS